MDTVVIVQVEQGRLATPTRSDRTQHGCVLSRLLYLLACGISYALCGVVRAKNKEGLS